MSSFVATCPACGEGYWHCFVGSTLVSGHKCPLGDEAAFVARQRQMAEEAERAGEDGGQFVEGL